RLCSLCQVAHVWVSRGLAAQKVEVSNQRAWCANWRKNRMTPVATTAWALIALANGHFTITPDLSKDSCMNLAGAPYGQRAICYEYLPGGPGVTMFIDVGS